MLRAGERGHRGAGLGGGRAEVGHQHDVVEPSRPVDVRLASKTSRPAPAMGPSLSGSPGRLVDRAAGGVDQGAVGFIARRARRRSGAGSPASAGSASRRRRAARSSSAQVDPAPARRPPARRGVVDDPHAERARPRGRRLADVPHPTIPSSCLRPGPSMKPMANDQGGRRASAGRLGHPARHGEHQGQVRSAVASTSMSGVLVGATPCARDGGEVEVVVADGEVGNDLQPRAGGREQRVRRRGRGAW